MRVHDVAVAVEGETSVVGDDLAVIDAAGEPPAALQALCVVLGAAEIRTAERSEQAGDDWNEK